MKFRKKPVVIEAEQWFPTLAHVGNVLEKNEQGVMAKWPCGVYLYRTVSIIGGRGHGEIVCPQTPKYYIDTLEGRHEVTPGDWIITGVKGEKYPCKPDIFEMTYEKVDE